MAGEISLATPRLIEAGFPCHQVGAETTRERDTGKAPPTHRLHVWWARRPLTPSRAAVLASILPAGTDPDWFLRQLGIERVEALVNDVPWVLTSPVLKLVESGPQGEYLTVNPRVVREMTREQVRRARVRDTIATLMTKEPSLSDDPVLRRWKNKSAAFPEPLPPEGSTLRVRRLAADPNYTNRLMELKESEAVQKVLGRRLALDAQDLYGYERAFGRLGRIADRRQLVMLDPTAGGGSIPFEALRIGLTVIANELNPVAAVILEATLRYPLMFGTSLAEKIRLWGSLLLANVDRVTSPFFVRGGPLPTEERRRLELHLARSPELVQVYDYEEPVDYLYVRQVTCPHCGGEAPLLNTCWLSKDDDPWGVRVVVDGSKTNGKVTFQPYRVVGGKGPLGEAPNMATVSGGAGICVHCGQAISAEEIKAQARGESKLGGWQDRLYAVAVVRLQPKLDKNGKPRRYKSGERAGEIITEKVRYFRAPNDGDLDALAKAQAYLQKRWPQWEAEGLIPTESFPPGNDMRPVHYGMIRWCDMFTPRQLVGHLTMVEELNKLEKDIIAELGLERGRAVVTYLQFVIDKCLDYNSRQTRWEYTRRIVKGTFGRHDFSVKWTFGEMILSGPHSGIAWALDQVVDAYSGIAELVEPVRSRFGKDLLFPRIMHGTAASMDLPDRSVDVICMDPPYYNNVQYAELSDYFYVWQKRTLKDLYPHLYERRWTNKQDEAVANPARDGSSAEAAKRYERMMAEIFAECRRVLRDDGIMTLMFTHKTHEAWETLTHSLIDSGWVITSSMPVESESAESIHQKGKAAAASSIFLSCRKRMGGPSEERALWRDRQGGGVAREIRDAVRRGLEEMNPLRLSPVDEMVASYGRALRVLSERWPVIEGDGYVSPTRAMNEAAAVVAQHRIMNLTKGRLQVDDLDAETAFSLVVLSVFSVSEFPYDQALNLSRSLNVRLVERAGNYNVESRVVGMNRFVRQSRRARIAARDAIESTGYQAPLVISGSKVRLIMPRERDRERLLDRPQTQWDMLHGVILSYQSGDMPSVRSYLDRYPTRQVDIVIDLLSVWLEQVGDERLAKEARAILFGLRQ